MEKQRIGEWLVARGLVRPRDLERALDQARHSGRRLGSELLEQKLISEAQLVEALAALLGVPGVDLSRSAVLAQHLDFIPRDVAELERILPLKVTGGQLLLAMSDPQNVRVLEEVQLISGLTVLPHVALGSALERAIGQAYDFFARGERLWRGHAVPQETAEESLALVQPAADLPLAEPPPDDLEIAIDEDDSFGDEEELASVSARPGPRLILVVDDEEEILTLVARALEKKGYRVEKARRGQEALTRVGELLPDLVLLDANLPEVHGFDICKKIKANPRFARIPVLMMTAVYRGWRFAQDSRETFGASDYIEKPFRLDDLLRRVEHHLSRAIGEPARDREKAERLYAEGLERLETGEAGEAARLLEQSAEADPFQAKTHFQLGRALQQTGDAYRAISAYERSVDLKPDHFPTLRALAALYQQKGFRRKAIEAWERAIPAAPDEATRQKIKTGLLALL